MSLWVKRYRPIEPTAPPDVGCCSKAGHGFASQRNVDKGQSKPRPWRSDCAQPEHKGEAAMRGGRDALTASG